MRRKVEVREGMTLEVEETTVICGPPQSQTEDTVWTMHAIFIDGVNQKDPSDEIFAEAESYLGEMSEIVYGHPLDGVDWA